MPITVTGPLKDSNGDLVTGEVKFLPKPFGGGKGTPKTHDTTTLVSGTRIAVQFTDGEPDFTDDEDHDSLVLFAGEYEVRHSGTKPYTITVPTGTATRSIAELTTEDVEGLPSVDLGLPTGGTARQLPFKQSSDEGDSEWGDPEHDPSNYSLPTGSVTLDDHLQAIDEALGSKAGAVSYDPSNYDAGSDLESVDGHLEGLDSVLGTLNSHAASTSNPHSVTATQVGLGSVDNTSDADKPVSTAQQSALDLKADASALSTHTGDTSNPHSVTKTQVGLGSVDNTADVDKPVSTAQQSALDLKADASALSTHTGDTDNPHAVTPTQIGALGYEVVTALPSDSDAEEGKVYMLTQSDISSGYAAPPGLFIKDQQGWFCLCYSAPYDLGDFSDAVVVNLIAGAEYIVNIAAEVTSWDVGLSRPGRCGITLTNTGGVDVSQPDTLDSNTVQRLLSTTAWNGVTGALVKVLLEWDGSNLISSSTEMV